LPPIKKPFQSFLFTKENDKAFSGFEKKPLSLIKLFANEKYRVV
jgi:hypothetical protein